MYKTYSSYRAAWDNADKIDPPVPINLDIEMSSICQLACSMCYWGDSDFGSSMKTLDHDGKPKKRFMSFETARALIDEADQIGIPAIKTNFRGESTLNPEFSKIISYAATKSFHDILVNTNGYCNDHAIEGLMKATKCMISLDSTDPKIYPQIRVKGNMDRVFEVIRELKRRKHPNLWIRRVITTINKDEPFVERVKELFGQDTKVSEHFTFDRNHYQHLSLENDFKNWARMYCTYPSVRLVVLANGRVVACCVAWSEETLVGEWPKQSLLEIWNGEPIKRLRATLRSNDLQDAPELCRNCTSFMAYKRPEREFVQDVEGKASLAGTNS